MRLTGIEGKVAVVTGAAGDIGAAVCQRLAGEGAFVVATDIREDAVHEIANSLPTKSIGIGSDVTTEAGVDAYVAAALEAFGRVDLFHNNAAVEGHVAPIIETDLADFERVLAVNVRGVFLGLRAVLRQMVKQGNGGAVVNTSSVAGLRAGPGQTAYVTSKHAVLGLSKNAAAEMGPLGIRVNVLCPGAVASRMTSSLLPQLGKMANVDVEAMEAAIGQRIPLGRYCEPAEVAAAVAWLLSEEASYAHGQEYALDGGYTLL